MSDVKTSEHFYGQDEYHRSYFHDIDAPAPLAKDRVDPNLPDLESRTKVVDPDFPSAPEKAAVEEEAKSTSGKARTASGSSK